MARQLNRKDECCTADFLKQVLYIFNIVFLLAGIGVLSIAVWTITDRYQYVALMSTLTYPILTYFLLVAGSLVFFVAVLGCCAVYKNYRPFIILYIFLLLLIFLMEAMVGLLSYVYEEQVEADLELNLNNTFLTSYMVDSDKTAAIDFLQEKFNCCGAVSFQDWKYAKWKIEDSANSNIVPDSCCKTPMLHCGRRDHPSNINYSGCLSKMAQHMRGHLIILSAVGLGICVLQIFGIVFSCQLYFKLKDVVDDV